jgi:hypothetical protein
MTGRGPTIRVPTSATEWASVLRPCPVAKTRARGGQLQGDLDDLLTISQQPVGDMPADAMAALDGGRTPVRVHPDDHTV